MLQTQEPRPTPEIDEALASLPEKYRNPLSLRYLEQRPLEEVARRLGCGVDAARMRISRGVEKLRDVLGRRGPACSLALLAAILGEGLAEAVPSGLSSRIAGEVLAGRVATAHAPLIAALGRQVGGSASSAASATAAFRRWCGPSSRSAPVHSASGGTGRASSTAPGAAALT